MGFPLFPSCFYPDRGSEQAYHGVCVKGDPTNGGLNSSEPLPLSAGQHLLVFQRLRSTAAFARGGPLRGASLEFPPVMAVVSVSLPSLLCRPGFFGGKPTCLLFGLFNHSEAEARVEIVMHVGRRWPAGPHYQDCQFLLRSRHWEGGSGQRYCSKRNYLPPESRRPG